jgi:hypothetical protein
MNFDVMMRTKSDYIVKANNYNAIWELLEDRYGNEKVPKFDEIIYE